MPCGTASLGPGPLTLRRSGRRPASRRHLNWRNHRTQRETVRECSPNETWNQRCASRNWKNSGRSMTIGSPRGTPRTESCGRTSTPSRSRRCCRTFSWWMSFAEAGRDIGSGWPERRSATARETLPGNSWMSWGRSRAMVRCTSTIRMPVTIACMYARRTSVGWASRLLNTASCCCPFMNPDRRSTC